MTPAFTRQPKPVTVDRLERALDRLAEIIVKKGHDGWKWVPIYKKLDEELTRLKALEDDMRAIRERAQRSKDRLAEIMVKLGPEGERCLPIYKMLEAELASRQADKQMMENVRERAERSKIECGANSE